MNQSKKNWAPAIEAVRKQKGFHSKSRFAAIAGLNAPMISRIEKGTAGNVGPDVINKLAKALDETPEYIRECIEAQYDALKAEENAQASAESFLTRTQWDQLTDDEKYKGSFGHLRDGVFLTDQEVQQRKAAAQESGVNFQRGLDVFTEERMNPHTKSTELVQSYRGVTQDEMAARCGISLHTYRDIEQGRSDPQEKTIRMLKIAFGHLTSHGIRRALLIARFSAEDRATKRSAAKAYEENLERIRSFKEFHT